MNLREKSVLLGRTSHLVLGLALYGGMVGLVETAAAQEIEEILVTAQKRTENVQDVPIAITALDTNRLERSQIENVGDLMNYVPNLQFGNFTSTATVAIRGIGHTNTTAGGDPGVAIHLDGVYIGRPVASVFNFWDLERMEVLRGPQGTLYGRNTTGGSINFITKKPTDKYEGKFEAGYGKFQHFQARGILNVPMGEKAAGRFSASFEDSDGYQRNLIASGTDANDSDTITLRGTVRFNPAENIELTVGATYAEVNGVGSTHELRLPFRTATDSFPPLPPGFRDFAGVPNFYLQTIFSDAFFNRPDINAILAAQGINSIADIENFFGFTVFPAGPKPSDASLNDLVPNLVSKDTPESVKQDFLNINATLTWDLDNVTFKSITSYGETSFFNFIDLDGSDAPVMDIQLDETQDQFSQEFQLASASGGPLEWIVGAYFFTEDATRISTIFNSDFDLFGALLGRDVGFKVGGSVEATSYAVFGQASYDVLDTLQITAGGRWSWDEKDAVISLLSPFPSFDKATIVDNAPVGRKWNEPSGKVSIDWRPKDDLLLYGSYSRGYKSGGINLNGNPATAVYDPETNDVLEIGAKTQFNDRIQINFAAFYNDYKDIQVQTFGPTGAEIVNAASATIKGIEVEGLVLLSESMEIDFSLGILDAQFDDFPFSPPRLPLFPFLVDPTNPRAPSGPGVLGPPPTNFADNRLSRSPKLTLSIGAQKRFDLSEQMGSLTFRADFHYQGSQFFDVDNGLDAQGDSYSNLDLRLRWESASEQIYLEGFVTNATDEVQIGDILISIPFLGLGVDLTTYQPPRQWGFRVGYVF